MQRESRKREVLAQPTEADGEDLQEHQIIELPDREAISIVNTSTALPLGASVGAGLLIGA